MSYHLVALSPSVLVVHRDNAMNFISVSGIENQMSLSIRSGVIEVRNRIRRVGNDV